MALHHAQIAIVEKIIESLESGVLPWRKQYVASASRRGMPYNAVSGKAYRGINVVALLMRPFPIEGGWLTYKQAIACDGNVRQGEKSTVVFYYKKMKDVKKTKETGADCFYMLCKSYLVFHVSQCDNINNDKLFQFPQVAPVAPRSDMRNLEADKFVSATKATIRVRSDGSACYIPALDVIYLHEIEQYENSDAYYSTLFHELAHWTGPRLARKQSMQTKTYAFEELIAELCSCFTLPQFGMSNIASNERYLATWIAALRETPKILMQAASAASTANAFLNAFETGASVVAECDDDSEDIEQAA